MEVAALFGVTASLTRMKAATSFARIGQRGVLDSTVRLMVKDPVRDSYGRSGRTGPPSLNGQIWSREAAVGSSSKRSFSTRGTLHRHVLAAVESLCATAAS